MTRREERKKRRDDRKATKRAKSIMVIMAIISILQWWFSRAPEPDTPADLEAVRSVEYDPGQPLSSENYDPSIYRLSEGEWGTHRWQDSRTGTICSRKAWVPDGELLRTKQRDFSGPREPCNLLRIPRNERIFRAREREAQIPDAARRS